MLKGYSLRKSAEIVGVTWVTLFYWRHKLLSAIKQIDFEHFDGIVLVDETYFLYSQKGQLGNSEHNPRKRGGKSTLKGILVRNKSAFYLLETELKQRSLR